MCKGSGVVDGVKNVSVTIPAGDFFSCTSLLDFFFLILDVHICVLKVVQLKVSLFLLHLLSNIISINNY